MDLGNEAAARPVENNFSRRERQILDIIYHHGPSTVAEVRECLPNAPGYSAVRALMRIMEEKGLLTHSQCGHRYIYAAVRSLESAASSALRRVVDTFFGGSHERAVELLLSACDASRAKSDTECISRTVDAAEYRPSL